MGGRGPLEGAVEVRYLPFPERGCSFLRLSARIAPWMTVLVVFSWALAFAQGGTAAVEVIHSRASYAAGGSYPLLLVVRIQATWFLHGERDTGEGLIPTAFSFAGAEDLRIRGIRFPAPAKRKFDYTSKPIEVYSGDLLVLAELSIDPQARQGERHLEGRLSYQACSSQVCRPPETVPVHINLAIVPVGSEAEILNAALFEKARGQGGTSQGGSPWTAGSGLLLSLVGIFLGGLALNLTPCVYPLIPITVSYFGGRAPGAGGLRILHGALYLCGLAITNSLLGLTAALTGGMLGGALQNPLVLAAVAVILLAMGLSFFGLWDLRLPSALTRIASKNLGGSLGSLFMGLTLGIVAAPCVGPFIIGLLTYVGQKGEPLLGLLYFFVLSLGLGLPLAVLGIFSGQVDRLPLSGEWMVWVRKGLGWVLVGMAAYVLWPLLPGETWRVGLLAAVLAAAGLHLGWVDRSRSRSPIFPLIKKAVGAVALIGAILLLAISLGEKERVVWQVYDDMIMKEARSQGKAVLLDFYADWCPPCRAMEKDVFRQKEVVALSKGLLTVRVDLTTRHPSQEALQRRYGVRGVPTMLFINRHGTEETDLRIESYADKEVVLAHMRRLLERP